MALARRSGAEEVAVPVGLEAELLVKVVEYDKNLAARAGEKVQVVIVVKPGNPDSARVALQMERALAGIRSISGLDHDEITVIFAGAAELAKLCRARHASVVFLPPGFRDDVAEITRAFTGADVLTATAVPEYVPQGIVLGFDVVSGRPKLLVNLAQARRQNVALRAEALKLMKVFE